MKNERKLFLCIVALAIIGALVGQVAAEDPLVGAVSISPQNPTALSNITVTAKISGDDLEAVHLIYKECDPEICKLTKNTTMTEISNGTYQVTFSLAYDKATYITYYFEIKKAGVWTKTEDVDVPLLPLPNDNGSSGNGNDQQSPGFELFLLLAAVGLLILFGRKRFK